MCTSLKILHLPEGLTTIEAGAIDRLYSLEEIVFPSTITEIMHPQWDWWKNIKRIYCKAQFPPDNGTNSAIGTRADGEWSIYDVPFYIPKGCTKNYTAIGEWSSFRNYIETDEFPGGSSVETIKVDSENDGPIYDLMGRRVSQPMKGTIYIQNGKKFVCK